MRSAIISSLILLAALFANIAVAEEEPFIDGDAWLKSTDDTKIAYVLGAGDFLTMEYVSQMEYAEPTPTTEQTTVQSFWAGLEGQTMDSIVDTVDGWYAANPEDLDTPVLVVIWNEIVEPKIAE